ncbi:hypothetical protein SOVF_068480, partial [Spinacia oleracea]
MPRHTRRKLAECSVVRAAEEDASDDEAAAINVPEGGMVPRRVPTFVGTGWSPSDLVLRPEFHLSQQPRAGLDLRAVLSYSWGGLAYSHFLYEMKWASRTAPESEPSIAALWSVLE